MALFSSRKQNVFQPTAYGHSRHRRRIPRWLVLILTGIVLGAGGVLFVQKSYGPTLLTAEESEKLHYDLNSANVEIQRLQSQLNQHTRDLNDARTTLTAQTTELEETKEQTTQLRNDILVLANAAAPDPRGTSPGIRAASFSSQPGTLDYTVLIMQDDPDSATFEGQVEFVVEGRYPNGRNNTIALDAMPIEFGHYLNVSGSAELPDDLTARQVTVRVTPKGSDKLAAMRILRVSR